MRKIKLCLIILWMIVIFMFSNQKAVESSKLSDGLILRSVRIIEKINHKQYSDEEILKRFIYPVRKLAHVTIYFILGFLVYLYIKDLKIDNKIIISILICVLYATSDEIHQLFILGRSGEVKDVLIDTSGSVLGILFLKILKSNKKIKNYLLFNKIKRFK